MGVFSASFSMSTTADVVYTHKKFKRAATESWDISEQDGGHQPKNINIVTSVYSEPKHSTTSSNVSHELINGTINSDGHASNNQDVHQCDDCGLKFDNISNLQKHLITHASELPHICRICNVSFKTQGSYVQHIRATNHIQYSEGFGDRENNSPSGTRNVFEKEYAQIDKTPLMNNYVDPYNRNKEFIVQNSESNEYSGCSKSAHKDNTTSSTKNIYKPKFRAHYSADEYSLKIPQYPLVSSAPMSPHNPISTSYHCDAIQPSAPNTNIENDSTKLYNNTRPNLPPLNIKSSKKEIASIGSWSGSPNSVSIWKGIKSPSPELVGQHINKLITENEAIVDTHNTLWALKHRRQSSISSSSSDSDGSATHKNRRLSLTDQHGKLNKSTSYSASPYPKDRNQAFNFESTVKDSRSIYSPSLPHPQFISHPSVSSASASKSNISTSYTTTMSPSWNIHNAADSSHYDSYSKAINDNLNLSMARDMLKARGAHVECTAVMKPNPEPVNDNKKLFQAHIPYKNDEVNVLCSQCGTNMQSISDLDNHLKYYCSQNQMKHIHSDSNNTLIYNSKPNSVQESALDLHKRLEDKPVLGHNTATPPLYGSSSYGFDTVDGSAFLPNKKRKYSSYINDTPSNESYIRRPKAIEESSNQNNSKHHLFGGGEVQICDGKERKTMKIEPTKTENFNLDMISPLLSNSKMSSKGSSIVATTVVVTIAKSGLNSGGTVQVESKTSTSTKTVSSNHTNIHSHHNPSHFNQNRKLSPGPIPEISDPTVKMPFPSPYVQYAPKLQLPNLSIPGVPAPNMSALMYNNPVPSSSLFTGGIVKSTSSQSKMNTLTLPSSVLTTNKIAESKSPLQGISSPNIKTSTISSQTTYPRTIVFGEEKVPYVPGIPGPYSQSGSVDVIPRHIPSSNCSKTPINLYNDVNMHYLKGKNTISSPIPVPRPIIDTPLSSNENLDSPKLMRNMSNSPVSYFANSIKSTKTIGKNNQTSVISIAMPSSIPNNKLEKVDEAVVFNHRSPNMTVENVPIISSEDAPTISIAAVKAPDINKPIAQDESQSSSSRDTNVKKEISSNDDDTFLVPRKRPDSLAIKPQSLLPKSSLIGSTLVSPDTPRPKKSCAQLLLNGSAYTYLALKVTTRCFFCCILRPQPMYVPQSTDPKLSMYSNWQLRKPVADNVFNLGPVQAMNLYVSKTFRNQSYTIAKQKDINLITTHSTYWTFKDKSKTGCESSIKTPSILQNKELKERESQEESTSKRIKIFEGGFKTNEDYTYVRGRGRGRYVCGTCDIRCKKPSMLKKHIRTHTDLRPYSCSHCTFSFKTKGNLTKHLKSKAHYKRCVEIGINPVPTTVDESHINQQALEIQGRLEASKESAEDQCEEDEDEEDEDEEDEDFDEEDTEDEQFEDAQQTTKDINEKKSSSFNFMTAPLMSTGMNPDMWPKSAPDLDPNKKLWVKSTSEQGQKGLQHGKEMKDSPSQDWDERKSQAVPVEDNSSPMDLSVKRPSVLNLSATGEKSHSSGMKRSYQALAFDKGQSFSDNMASPSTPIREHPSVILSPVTESSVILKSIYSTTMLASSTAPKGKKPSPDPSNYKTGHMLQAYLKECAVLDTTMKRHQYHMSSSSSCSSSDNSPVSPRVPNHPISSSTIIQHTSIVKNSSPSNTITPSTSIKDIPKQLAASSTATSSTTTTSSAGLTFITSVVNFHSDKTSDSGAFTSKLLQALSSADSKLTQTKSIPSVANKNEPTLSEEEITVSKSDSSPLTSTNTTISCANSLLNNVTSITRMPTPPANLTVLNSCGMDSKTAFLAPSGVIPSSTNRMGPDDGKSKCTICHKEFGKQSQLSLHMNIHYMERPFRCHSCGVSFRSSGHLQKHKRSSSHYNKVNMNMTFGTPSTENPRPYKCHDCAVAFRIHGHLSKHLRSKLHIMKLECLSKLPFGTYAEIERSGISLNEIDTADCDVSLKNLQVMANKLYEKDPAKFNQWQSQHSESQRVRTISNSSINSDEYPLQDEQDETGWNKNMEEDSGDEDGEISSNLDGNLSPMTGQSLTNIASIQLTNRTNASSSEIKPIQNVRTFPCMACNARFASSSLLEAHLPVHQVQSKSDL